MGRRDDEADFHISLSKKSRFLAYARHFSGGGTLIKNLATLEHNKGYLLCSNVAIIRRSIMRGVEYPPARIGEFGSALRGGGEIIISKSARRDF